MNNKEAYNHGFMAGRSARQGITPAFTSKTVPLPTDIDPRSPQAIAYRVGYRDGLEDRITMVKK